MKKKLFAGLGLLFLFNLCLKADNRYWIGGTGSWNDASHWSAASGGAGGASVPTLNDDVFFDQHSFTFQKQVVKLQSNAFCHNLSWSGIDKKAVFSGVSSQKLTVGGSFTLSTLLINGFKGTTEFVSSSSNTISTKGVVIYGDWTFNGSGSWVLNDSLKTSANVALRLLKGNFNTNNKKVICGSFIGNSSSARSLDLGTSQVTINDIWDFSASANITLLAENSTILFNATVDNTNFRSGGLRYGGVGVAPQAQNTTTCVFPGIFTITLTADSVTCNGQCDGAAHAVVTGGTGSPIYNWNFAATPAGDGTSDITGLCASANSVSVTETIAGVPTTRTCFISVGDPNPLNVFEAMTTMATCNNACDGFIDVDEVGGTPPYTYSWSGLGASNDTVLNVCAGTYTATVTDGRGCQDSSAIVTITEPALLIAPGASSDVTCNGFCDGTATVNASGGTSPYSYVWTSTPVVVMAGQGTPAITALCPGTFTCTVTDTNGCTATFNTTIIQPTVLTLTMSQVNASCGGICDATATATVSGGTPPYTYSWSSGQTTTTASLSNTISGLCASATSYVCTVTDANGCVIADFVTITEPVILVATASGTALSCFNGCDGTATVVVTGGTPGYTYDWTPGSPTGDGTANITALCPGTYTVDVTDLNGCTDTGTVTIARPPQLLPNLSSTNVLCFGSTTGTATAAPTGGTPPYTYNWTPGNPPGDGTTSIGPVAAGNWCVTITDFNGCDTLDCVTITQPPLLTVSMSHTDVNCNGTPDGTATATPSGGTGPGYNYSWSPGGQTTQTAVGLSPGTYTVTVTDVNGCTVTGTAVITQPNAFTVDVTNTTLACFGDTDATATAVVSGGIPTYDFLWTPGGQTTSAITGLGAGSYTCTVTDNNGCIARDSVMITQPTAIVLSTAVSNETCFGSCNGVANVIVGFGTAPYNYNWTPGNPTGDGTNTITSLCSGTYTVTVTDANGCTATATATITSPPQLFGNPTVIQNVLCNGAGNGSAYSAATGGTLPYTYNWTPGTPVGDGTDTITNLIPGTWTLLLTDALGCTSTQSITITQPAALSVPINSVTSSCGACNGSATAAPLGGTSPFTYLWNSVPSQSTPTASGLCPNLSYTVTATDANGCTATNSVLILPTVVITLTTSNTTLSCNGACDGTATANIAGGTVPYTYQWTDSGGSLLPGGTNISVTNLCAGTYYVRVTDFLGCFNIDSVTFTNPIALDVTATHTDETCGAACDGTATATPTGGTGTFTYSWLPGGQTTQVAVNLCQGTYTCTVTDVSGCTDTVSVIIGGPPSVIDNVTITDANCLIADGVITVAPTGGTGSTYTYFWSPGLIAGQGTNTATNLLPGAYTLVITDSTSCAFTFNYLVNNINGPTLTMSHTNVTCTGACNGNASVDATGGVPGYTYLWAPALSVTGGQATDSIFSLCGGTTFTVTVTDVAGCITNDTATIIDPLPIDPHEVVTNETCGGACDATITLAPTGGTGASYTYAWSGGLPPTAGQTNLCAGSYTVTISDVNGCDTVLVVNVTAPVAVTATMASTNVTCNGADDGTATITAGGGTGAGTYIYSWLPNPPLGPGFPLPNIINLGPGTYTVTVTDANGCTATDTAFITEPAVLTALTSQTNASCFGICDGTATITPSGGTSPYTYSWSPGGQTTQTAISLCGGSSYSPVVTDSNGCTVATAPVLIVEPSAIVPTLTTANPNCNLSCDGTASVSVVGGTPAAAGYSYFWSPGVITGQGTANATALCAGNYILTVTDSMNCNNTQNFTLTDPPVLSATVVASSPTCSNSCNGSATATPVGGTAGYTYSWTPGGATTATATSLCPGVYTFIVTDTNACADTQSVTIINPAPIDVTIGSTPATCGICDGTITLTPITGSSPYTYLWAPAPTIGQGTSFADSVCAGLYSVTVTDNNGCDSTFLIPMNNAGGPTGETVTSTDVTCFGGCNGTGSVIPIGGVPPFLYSWLPGAFDSDSAAINLCAGNYFVQVTDSNVCMHFSPVTINEPLPILANASITSAPCSNVCTGSISLVPSGGTPGTTGYTYSWMPGGMTTSTISGLCPGTYTVTITDSSLCTTIDSFTVTQSAPVLAAMSSTNIFCSTACNGTASIAISSGTAPYTIQWNDPAGQTNDTAFALCAGTYSVTVTDAIGCTATFDTTITASSAIVANATVTNANCGVCDGSALLAPSGGVSPYTYLWSNAATTANATALCAGLYTVDVTDSAGCTTNFGIAVSNTGGPTSVTITATNVTCNGAANGAVTAVTPTGGTAPYTFLWINHGGLTTSTLSGLSAGVYFVQVTDAGGCSIVDSVTITEPAPILANNVSTAPTCSLSDGSITVTPSGGNGGAYTLLWNTGPSTPTISGLAAGIYSVAITDVAGCTSNIVIPLNSQGAPTLAMSSTDVLCAGSCNGTATVVATGSLSPYVYLWNDLTAQVVPTATSLCAGTYAVQVTGSDGCIGVSTITVNEPDSIAFSVTNVIDPLCAGNSNGSATVIPSGGTLSYTYAWTPSGGSAATASGLAANTYTVTVTDANGCIATQSTAVVDNTSLVVSNVTTQPSCSSIADGTIDETVTGGTGTYTYQWSGGSTATTEDLNALLGGTYTITITDGNGCIAIDSATLTPTTTVIALAGNDTTFCDAGTLTLSAAGSTNGTNFSWFDMANQPVGTGVSITITPPSGTTGYYVIVDDGAGCPDNDSINVTSNALPGADAGVDVAIFLGQSTVIGGSPTTGSAGATIVWSTLTGLDNGTVANPTANPTVTTTYTVTVTSTLGCTSSDSIIVTVNPNIFIPDGISPNADGKNDEWIIDGIELFPNCNVEVYNRWGELLFQSPGYKEHWKGTFKGKELPVGTYYYVIDLKDPLFPDVYTGPITLLR